MVTIDCLMFGKRPGEIKIVRRKEIYKMWWWKPYFKSNKDCWYGIDINGDVLVFKDDDGPWYIWHEPKKKVKKWLWVNAVYGLHGSFHSSQPCNGSIKLLWSETEFEE